MPCSDSDWCREVDREAIAEIRELRQKQWENTQKEFNSAVLERKLKDIEQRNHQLMRVICKVDAALSENEEWQQWLLQGDEEVRQVIQQHRISDEQRWWNSYKEKYSQFSKEEIAKMVRAGILEDI